MTLKPLELTNGTAVVTGGANGIGKGIVKGFSRDERGVKSRVRPVPSHF